MISKLRLYLNRQASSIFRYFLEQTVMFLFGWIPTIIGVGLRGLFYRVILKMDGMAAIESRVRIRFAERPAPWRTPRSRRWPGPDTRDTTPDNRSDPRFL